uniref:Uncharacterized protein n=1 Tax=Micrurus carvalhoi TaxID=3147026 RepID=A0A2H6MUI1_9SAUR
MGVSAPAAWSAVIHLSSMLAIEEMANVTQLYLFQIQKQAYFKSGSGLQNLHDQWHATIIYFLKECSLPKGQLAPDTCFCLQHQFTKYCSIFAQMSDLQLVANNNA